MDWFLGIISSKLYRKESLIKRFIVKTLLLFYLLSSYLSATHIHSSDEAHADSCSVCIVAKTLQSVDVIQADISLAELPYIHVHRNVLHLRLSLLVYMGYFSTAPPSVS
ncbi:MAG: hypothetical protein L3J47_09790 [Sulfurovum sp.]|nr:hypothetical protein [Sulfurovum sp.]